MHSGAVGHPRPIGVLAQDDHLSRHVPSGARGRTGPVGQVASSDSSQGAELDTYGGRGGKGHAFDLVEVRNGLHGTSRFREGSSW